MIPAPARQTFPPAHDGVVYPTPTAGFGPKQDVAGLSNSAPGSAGPAPDPIQAPPPISLYTPSAPLSGPDPLFSDARQSHAPLASPGIPVGLSYSYYLPWPHPPIPDSSGSWLPHDGPRSSSLTSLVYHGGLMGNPDVSSKPSQLKTSVGTRKY